MIPLLAVVHVHAREGLSRAFKPRPAVNFRLWVPLFMIWLLLAPLVLVLLPFMMLACVVIRINPFRTLATLWHILAGLRGTNIQINDPKADVLVRIA